MSNVEANITIDLPDGVDPRQYIETIRKIIAEITSKKTDVHVTEVDDPLTTNPIGPR